MKFERVVNIKEYSWPCSVTFYYPDLRKSMNDRLLGYMMRQTTIYVRFIAIFSENDITRTLRKLHADTAQYENAAYTSPILPLQSTH
jgi:hypothetical protein